MPKTDVTIPIMIRAGIAASAYLIMRITIEKWYFYVNYYDFINFRLHKIPL